MHAKGTPLRALWMTAAVTAAIASGRSSGPHSSASAASASSAFVGAAAAAVAPVDSFHARAPRCGAWSTCTPRRPSTSSSSSSSSSASMAFASAARDPRQNEPEQHRRDQQRRPFLSSSPVAAAVPAITAAATERTTRMGKALFVSGGGATSPAAAGEGQAAGFGLASAWGVVSVVFILMNAVKRLAPIALQPFTRGDFTTMQWAMYGGFSVLMAYAEGFKGFQKKFSPLVVKRALTLDASPAGGVGGEQRRRPGPLRLLLAGPYSMGLFHATKKRRTVSWGLTTGVLCLVQVVKRLPYPWRSIVDAGVVVGLSYGTLSICAIWARALFFGQAPAIDPALPPLAEGGDGISKK